MSSQYQPDDLHAVKAKLDSTGPGMCVAKWKQVTMHLQNGHTHSCHHPVSHHVPLQEVQANPTALHNTNFKKEQRRQMLTGERPKECDYCWRVEDSGSNNFSDRVLKSNEYWARPFQDTILQKPWDDDVDPSYVEVSFGNVCNFKCSYCSPHISSKWMEEVQQEGHYKTSQQFNNLDYIKQANLMPIPNNQENPYVEAFWKWWPKMYNSLMHFRITGGEPLLNKNTFRVLDHIIENPNTNLDFSINTNLCPPKDIIDTTIEKLKRIQGEGKVKKLQLFTSAEAFGAAAEYIRFGMDYNLWIDNIYRMLNEVPGLDITVMSTYNVLSIPSYKQFLADMLQMRRTFPQKNEHRMRFSLDIPYLRYPPHQSIFIMDETLLPMLEEQVTFMYLNPEIGGWAPLEYYGFWSHETNKLRRIYHTAQHDVYRQRDSTEQEKLNTMRRDFVIFVDEHDRRRGTNFINTFPQLADFYHRCKQL
jgi:hypothetical protein